MTPEPTLAERIDACQDHAAADELLVELGFTDFDGLRLDEKLHLLREILRIGISALAHRERRRAEFRLLPECRHHAASGN